MDLSNSSTREWYAREVAALAADGMDTAHIWMQLDLSAPDVESLYDTPEFESAMRKHGDDLWEAWSLSRSEDKARTTIHQKILSHAEEYWNALHEIALDAEAKVETRARVLLSFLESTRQLGADATVGQTSSLSPATIALINRGDAVYRDHPRSARITSPKEHNVSPDES